MTESEPFQREMVQTLAGNRQKLARWLAARPSLTCQLPQAGIHGLLRVGKVPAGWDDERFCLELLEKEHLALHPGYYYDVQEEGVWLVFSLLKSDRLFQDALERLGRFLEAAAG